MHAHGRQDPNLGIAGIAHGDLSPSNILVDASGRVLVRDFGIPLQPPPPPAPDDTEDAAHLVARRMPEPFARLGRLHGKPGYMSPELVTRGVIRPRSDLFAVGIILYELVTFRRLFGGKGGVETLEAVALADVDERITRNASELHMPLRDEDAPAQRTRSGRRTVSRMILAVGEDPVGDDDEDATDARLLWSDDEPASLPDDVVSLLADIEPVGPS